MSRGDETSAPIAHGLIRSGTPFVVASGYTRAKLPKITDCTFDWKAAAYWGAGNGGQAELGDEGRAAFMWLGLIRADPWFLTPTWCVAPLC